MRTREDVQAFVECAHDFVSEVGMEEARRAFQEDPRWKSGPYYVFVDKFAARGEDATSYVFPPDPTLEGMPWGPLLDEFGSDYFVEQERIFNILGTSTDPEFYSAAWIYYSFENPATGMSEPKASYVALADWGGDVAIIGAGIYERDLPGTCNASEVSAMGVEMASTEDRLREFVRCAAMVIESKGYFGTAELRSDARWRDGSVYLFGVDEMGTQFFTGSPVRVNGIELMEWPNATSSMGLFAGRDMPMVGSTFGEAFLYYNAYNPVVGATQGKVAFVKRVMAQGVPVLIGSGYYLGSSDAP